MQPVGFYLKLSTVNILSLIKNRCIGRSIIGYASLFAAAKTGPVIDKLTDLHTGRIFWKRDLTTYLAMDKSWPKVVLFGDSLTQYGFSKDGCWTALVADFLQRKCDVINRGFSGYNTRWCKIILPKLVTKNDAANIHMVTIFLGANDSVDSALCPKQHVPLEEFKQNMRDMVKYLQEIGIARQKIVLISPPAVDEQKWEADCKVKGRQFGKYNKPTKEYAEACIEVAEEMGTPCVDFYTAMSNQKHWEEMLNDGLHLSPLGSEFLFELLKPSINKLTSELPMQLPLWADIDNQNPHALLDKY